MQLKDFIKTAIIDIVSGLKEAQKEIENHGATINPIGMQAPGVYVGDEKENNMVQVQRITFNLKVVELNESGSKARIGIATAIFGAGASAEDKGVSSNVSSLNFSVPIVFPANLPKENKGRKKKGKIPTLPSN